MSAKDDFPHQSNHIQQKPTGFFKPLKSISLVVARFCGIAVTGMIS
jgi:hypothetical protein